MIQADLPEACCFVDNIPHAAKISLPLEALIVVTIPFSLSLVLNHFMVSSSEDSNITSGIG